MYGTVLNPAGKQFLYLPVYALCDSMRIVETVFHHRRFRYPHKPSTRTTASLFHPARSPLLRHDRRLYLFRSFVIAGLIDEFIHRLPVDIDSHLENEHSDQNTDCRLQYGKTQHRSEKFR